MLPNPLTQLTLEDLRTRTSTKWREYDADVLPLWVAEMDVAVAEPVRRAVVAAIESGDTGYPSGHGYAEALGPFAEQRWGWGGVDPARSVVVADLMNGLVEAIRLVTEPGATVVVNPPVYPPFYPFVEVRAERRVLECPLGPGGRLDLAALEEAFVRAGAGSAYLLCSPHNPTGVVHTREELAAVARLAREGGMRVVVDEIHAPLVLEGARFTPYLDVEGSDDAFVLMSASKAWNLAGLKAALLMGGPQTADDLARVPEITSHGPSHFGVISHVAALREGGEWLDALLAGLAENRALLGDLLVQHLPDVGWRTPEGTFLAWLDCSALGLGDDPAAHFLEHGRVALTGGLPFGTGGAQHARLNYATSPEILTEAVERLAKAL